MTNRARPTWPDGAADSSKSPTPPARPGQGGNGKGQPNPPATPASNGRASTGQRPATPAPPQRPASSSSSGTTAKPVRPPQQPPVRPASSPVSGTSGAPARPLNPSTPGRPEPRPGEAARSGTKPANSAYGETGTTTPAYGETGKPAYGETGKPAYGTTGKAAGYGQTGKTATPGETFGDKVNAAKQAVLEKAAAVKDAATQVGSSSSSDARTDAAAKVSSRPQTRKARLRLSRLDPWSVMKTAFLLSIAFGIVTWVAVFIVWSAIGAAGVFDNINNTVSEVLGTPSAEPFRIEDYVNTGKVMGFTTLLACADVLIITALATLGSFLYNIAATLLGGLEVTLASED
ncbi:DUF3566 domain-containing protein [Kribbella sp. NPDC006257]|uniref:DUF3566 domain-containing protein n=1 Tax=Kribbella sp. NPDC006257 TaxID=3156738 RepID=UPI0033A12481